MVNHVRCKTRPIKALCLFAIVDNQQLSEMKFINFSIKSSLVTEQKREANNEN